MTQSYIKRLLLVACAVCAAQDARESRTVQTAQGPVRGYSTDGVFHFYGIPYATAPTGSRKFTASLPGPQWLNPLEAVNNKIICPQGENPVFDISKFDLREDCLIVNIYTPDTETTNLPVVVYFHGGGYQLGFGEMCLPNTLVRSKKVIAVTFNYRLGVHGFLCLGTENAPGNAGMKDQVALLHWVQKNISKFGGNPDEVTIAGYSAGATSVDLLMLSEMARGLYNKVIPESGASVGVWSMQIDPLQNARDFAKQLNFTDVDDLDSLDEFYSNLSFDAITSDIFANQTDSTFVFVPCVERDTGVEKFLDDTPVNILTQGKYRKVPVLYGFAHMEGMFRAPQFEQWKDKMNEKFSDFLPADLQFENDEERKEVAQTIKKFYFADEPVSEVTIQGYIDYFSDVMFTYPHLRSVNLQVEAGSDSIYLYEYTFFKPYLEGVGIPPNITKLEDAGHCVQTLTIQECSKSCSGCSNKRMKEILVELWVNFITFGTPVPEGSLFPHWPPVGVNRSPHMEIDEEITLKGPLLEKRYLFWDDIYKRFYRSPVAPTRSLHNNRGKDEL